MMTANAVIACEIAFEWLSLYGRHAPTCGRIINRIVPQEPRSGMMKDYGGRYATDEELENIPCTCGLVKVHRALCQAAPIKPPGAVPEDG